MHEKGGYLCIIIATIKARLFMKSNTTVCSEEDVDTIPLTVFEGVLTMYGYS